jgi:hypothetical protein
MRKMGARFAALLALALAAMALTASSALAVTVTPSGTFTANGNSVLTGGFGAVTCTDVTVTGTVAEAGTGSFNATFASCQDSFNNPCNAAITSGSVNFTISNGNGDYTLTSTESGSVTGASCAISCTFESEPGELGGTINTTANDTTDTTPTITLAGPVTSPDTANCGAGGLTGTVTVDVINGVAGSSLTITTA